MKEQERQNSITSTLDPDDDNGLDDAVYGLHTLAEEDDGADGLPSSPRVMTFETRSMSQEDANAKETLRYIVTANGTPGQPSFPAPLPMYEPRNAVPARNDTADEDILIRLANNLETTRGQGFFLFTKEAPINEISISSKINSNRILQENLP